MSSSLIIMMVAMYKLSSTAYILFVHKYSLINDRITPGSNRTYLATYCPHDAPSSWPYIRYHECTQLNVITRTVMSKQPPGPIDDVPFVIGIRRQFAWADEPGGAGLLVVGISALGLAFAEQMLVTL